MIIVTGGAGFIGSNLIRGLNRLGYEDILVVDNLANAQKHRNLNRLYFTDFVDKQTFLKILPGLSGIKTVFHQGACSSTTETDGVYMMHNNYEYSKALLHHCLEQRIDFLYASSASVYGNGTEGFREDRICEYPLNVYAFSKFMFDNYVRHILKQNTPTSQVLGLRYFNVYGYQENHKGNMASVVFRFYHQIKAGGAMKLFEGSEHFLRDFIFVEDAVRVNLHCFQHKTQGIFNCGTGVARSFVAIANIIQQSEPQATIDYIPFPEHLQGKYQTYTQADLYQLRTAGYQEPFTSLEQGVAQYYRQLKENDGYFRHEPNDADTTT